LAKAKQTKAKRETGSGQGSQASPNRAEASLQAFREALEKSVTISRDRLQEVLDDAVRRGRMTRSDAEELVSRLVTRGREQAEDIIAQLERLLSTLREDVTPAVTSPRRTAGRAAGRARRGIEDAAGRTRKEVGARVERSRRRAVAAADRPLATADKVRRRSRVGFPISAYDQLTARQIDKRLVDLSQAELRAVRDYERRNKARKGVLRSIERKLD
jgi:polyhydroxyalkanoate synthesis regulator phasin